MEPPEASHPSRDQHRDFDGDLDNKHKAEGYRDPDETETKARESLDADSISCLKLCLLFTKIAHQIILRIPRSVDFLIMILLLSIPLLLRNEISCEIRLQQCNALYTERSIVATQLHLIKSWEKVIQEAVSDADKYMGLIEDYCKLKEKYDGLLGSFFLSDDDRYNMYVLRSKLGGDFDVSAKHFIWDLTNELKQSLFELLQPLKISLYAWNIDEMKRQQNQFTTDTVWGNIEKKVERWKDKLIRLQSAVGRGTWNSFVQFLKEILERVIDKAVPLIANKAQKMLLS